MLFGGINYECEEFWKAFKYCSLLVHKIVLEEILKYITWKWDCLFVCLILKKNTESLNSQSWFCIIKFNYFKDTLSRMSALFYSFHMLVFSLWFSFNDFLIYSIIFSLNYKVFGHIIGDIGAFYNFLGTAF